MVVAEQDDEIAGRSGQGMPLSKVFAQVCCRAGLNYQFEHDETGWRLVLVDVERPDGSPEPIVSDYVKQVEAHRHLMEQAVSRGFRGDAAMPLALYR